MQTRCMFRSRPVIRFCTGHWCVRHTGRHAATGRPTSVAMLTIARRRDIFSGLCCQSPGIKFESKVACNLKIMQMRCVQAARGGAAVDCRCEICGRPFCVMGWVWSCWVHFWHFLAYLLGIGQVLLEKLTLEPRHQRIIHFYSTTCILSGLTVCDLWPINL